MKKKILIFLFLIFLNTNIIYSQEESLNSILKYIGILRKTITVDIPKEFEIVFEIYTFRKRC
jgi:hypothetical protein